MCPKVERLRLYGSTLVLIPDMTRNEASPPDILQCGLLFNKNQCSSNGLKCVAACENGHGMGCCSFQEIVSVDNDWDSW